MNRKGFCLLSLIILTFTIGTLLIIAHYRGPALIKKIGDKKLIERLELKENSDAIKYWKTPPATIYRKFYMFNVTNYGKVLKGSVPELAECGPYVYREEMEKRNMKHLDLNRVQYTAVSTLFFEPSLSDGSQHDVINFLNILELIVSAKIKTNPEKKQLFFNKTIDELIAGFSNYRSKQVQQVRGSSSDKFGLYSDKNGTELNTYVAYTGHDNIFDLGKLESWNDKKELDQWTTNSTRAINGSDGSKYPPKIETNQTLYFYNPDLCRSMHLEYLKDNEIDGVKTYDFHLPTNIFSTNLTLNPNNEGFCPKNDCYDGVQSIRECKEGLPMFASLPHFLNANETLVNNVKGLKPDKERHDYILSIDPLTGTTIQSKIRVQFNYLLEKKSLKDTFNIKKNIMLPLFWIELDIDTKPQVKAAISKIQSDKLWYEQKLQSSFVYGCGAMILCVLFIFVFTLNYFSSSKNKLEPSLTLDKNKNRRFIA